MAQIKRARYIAARDQWPASSKLCPQCAQVGVHAPSDFYEQGVAERSTSFGVRSHTSSASRAASDGGCRITVLAHTAGRLITCVMRIFKSCWILLKFLLTSIIRLNQVSQDNGLQHSQKTSNAILLHARSSIPDKSFPPQATPGGRSSYHKILVPQSRSTFKRRRS